MTDLHLLRRPATLAAALCLAAALGGCATGTHPGDPFERVNRATFKLNTELDDHIAQPVARGYQHVVPSQMRIMVHNFFANLGDVGNFANNLLQLRMTDAAEDLMRVAMNSTFGVGGLFDFATPAGLPRHHQDFGLTLARWGVPAGPYLMLPLFGPSSVRDGIGLAADVHFTPLSGYVEPGVRNPLYVTQFVSARADMLGATDLLKQAALDPYSFVRDAYIQQRISMTYKGSAAAPALPDYGDPGAAAPAGGANAAGASEPGDLPKYDDPDAATPATGAAPASGAGTR
jgi:phospholipid-binding lipoprotein MlaA